MIDAILFINDFPTLVAYLNIHEPNLLVRNEDGSIAEPPEVTGIARTPAISRDKKVMVYARLRSQEAERWRDTPGVEVLAEAVFDGFGTGDAVYQQIWADPDKLARYKSVYDRTPVEIGDGGTYTPPAKFGILAGA